MAGKDSNGDWAMKRSGSTGAAAAVSALAGRMRRDLGYEKYIDVMNSEFGVLFGVFSEGN
jgi:hypothetical protein